MKDWETRFNDNFFVALLGEDDKDSGRNKARVKDFIKEELEIAYLDCLETKYGVAIERIIKATKTLTRKELLLQIEEIVEGMKKKVPTEGKYTPEAAINIGSRMGYNQAIDDFTEKLIN